MGGQSGVSSVTRQRWVHLHTSSSNRSNHVRRSFSTGGLPHEAKTLIPSAPLHPHMAKQFGKLYVSILCTNCGFTDGEPVDENLNRCVGCGRFATDNPDVCCVEHGVKESPYPSGICPRCEQEDSVRAQEQEMHERRSSRRMHPTVDAPRF
jgi:hypothetical protein